MLWSVGLITGDVLTILFVWRLKPNTYTTSYGHQTRIQNYEKQLLDSSYLSVSQSDQLPFRMEPLSFHWMGYREILL